MLASLRNMFKVPDLRNKVLFTLLIIAIYLMGANIVVPGVNFNEIQTTHHRGQVRWASSASSTCSRAARSPGPRSSGSGSCRTSPPRSSSSSSRR